jgi:UTP--glucose-1-phosphate uridylyltransferase
VKTTDDLLVLRSDAYVMRDDAVVEPNPSREGPLPYVELDPRYYKILDAFEQRFPKGPPSLVRATRLVVRGDVRFGSGVVVVGSVEIRNDGPEALQIPDGATLAQDAGGVSS